MAGLSGLSVITCFSGFTAAGFGSSPLGDFTGCPHCTTVTIMFQGLALSQALAECYTKA